MEIYRCPTREFRVTTIVIVDVICGCAITLSLRSLTLALPSWRSTSMYLLAISWLISSSVSALSLWLGFLAHSLQTQSWDLPNVTLHFNVDVLLLGAWVLGVSTSWCVIEFNKVRLIFCSILFFQVRHPGWYHCSDVWLVFVYRIADYILNSSLSPHPEIILSVLPPAIFPSVLFTSDLYHYIQFALYAFDLWSRYSTSLLRLALPLSDFLFTGIRPCTKLTHSTKPWNVFRA